MPSANSPRPRDAATHGVLTDWISVPADDGPISAYMARPADAAVAPTVLVGFEMFGLSRYIRSVTDRVAGLGYTAVAPDFYHRFGERIDLPPTADGRAQGLELLQRLNRDQVTADARAIIDHVAPPGGDGDAAMVGLSAGGHIAYAVATRLPLAALAMFYPGWLTPAGTALSRPEPLLELTPKIAALGTPVLLLIGDQDHLYTPAQLDEIARRLEADGVRHEMVVYPETPHGFFCHERDSYRPAAAEDAFARLTALLARTLPVPRVGAAASPAS
jgi:carboxymethylenebutenolidase